MGHYLVMGRKTFESIGKPLPGRISIVLTRNENYHAYGCIIAHSLDEAIKIAKRNDEQELFVIGGGDIYRQALPLTDKIYLTSVETRVDTDTYFPMLLDSDWKVKESEKFEKSEQDEYPSEFKILERNH
jgi:dihydrofolate reductase